jgi:AcrR family transcriptional regulator
VYQYFPNKHAVFYALHQRHVAQVDGIMRKRFSQPDHETLEDLIGSLVDAMIEAHSIDPELFELLQTEVPHGSSGDADFAVRLQEDVRKALSLYDRTPGITTRPSTRSFLVANMIDGLGHAIILRRPRGLSLRQARHECCRAILAYLYY